MEGIALVKEAIRQTSGSAYSEDQLGHIEPYNDGHVRALMASVTQSFAEASAHLQRADEDEDLKQGSLLASSGLSADAFKTLLLQHSILRARRCLLAYHQLRLKQIAGLTLRLPAFPAPQRANLTQVEAAFQHAYSDSLQRMAKAYGGIVGLAGAPTAPPKDLYVSVRVVKDCGVIQTEYGPLYLDADSFHYVRKSDVQHLITQGFLLHMQ
jgi:GINS complex subunit 1